MKIPYIAFTVCSILCASRTAAADLSSTAIAPDGATRLSAVVGGHQILLNIWTRKIDIGKMGVMRPDVVHNSCTYSRVPCSVVEAVQIIVDKTVLFVPRSAYCDLSDLRTMELDAVGGRSTLTAYGGDASEAYEVKIEFDAERVTRRVMASSMDVKHPTEITTYYETSLPD